MTRKMILFRDLWGGIGCMIAKKRPFGAWSLFAALCCMAPALSAATFGNFTYTDNGTSITITGFPTSFVGAVVIPSTINGEPVTSIGSSAFQYCYGLTSVSIPPSVTSIGTNAFYNCNGLTSVTIPAGVTSIGSGAFIYCFGLTSVSIPSNVTSIGTNAFQGCNGLTSVTISAGVTSIGDSAFYGCTNLTSVTIPASVTSIGIQVFSGCGWLASISVDVANPSYSSSSNGVLFDKLQTTLIEYPGGKGGAYTIPSSVTSIGTYAFQYCRVTSVTIPSNITSIGSGAFAGCTGLTSISVDVANANYSSPGGVLFDKLQTSLIQFPAGKSGAYTIPSSVTSLADYAFESCSGLTSVAIPTGVTSIGSYAFESCSRLTSVAIPAGVTSIADYAFESCSGLTSVTIPAGATSIGTYAFNNCTKLTSVAISAGVTSIGTYAFQGCSGLTSVTIPSSVTNIGSGAFSGCTGLTSISVDVANANYSSPGGVLFDKLQTTLIEYPGGKSGAYTIPSSVTGIGTSAFEGCSGVTSVTIPAGVTSIGSQAFDYCYSLTSVTIPAGVTNIADYTFFGCRGLTSMSIPSSVTNIGNGAFRDSGLTSVTIPSSVTSIGDHAFENCSVLTIANFMGNAPTLGSNPFPIFGSDPFVGVASGFTVYYLSGSSGFTSPTWKGHAAFPMQGPQFTSSPPDANGTTGVSYQYSCTATGAPPPAFAVTSGALPDGLTISSAGTISGAPTAAGVFSGTITAANGTSPDATQAFTITINTALQSWRQSYFGTTANTGTAADSAVSNLDGLPNLLEYALGGDPTVANSAIRPTVNTVASNGANYLALTFTPQRSDITYAIEVSGDLTGAWTSISLAGLLTIGQPYTYTDTVAVAAGAPRFIRLRVSGQ